MFVFCFSFNLVLLSILISILMIIRTHYEQVNDKYDGWWRAFKKHKTMIVLSIVWQYLGIFLLLFLNINRLSIEYRWNKFSNVIQFRTFWLQTFAFLVFFSCTLFVYTVYTSEQELHSIAIECKSPYNVTLILSMFKNNFIIRRIL